MKSPATSVCPSPPARHWPVMLAAMLIGLGVLSAYHNSFTGALIFDDQPAILENPTIRQLWPLWMPLSPPKDQTVSGRPLANLSLAVNYALSGTGVWSYHAFNLIIHALAGLTLFGIVRRTLALVGRVIPNPPGPDFHSSNRRVKDNAPYLLASSPAALPLDEPGHSSAGATAGDSRFLPNEATLVALTVALLWSLHPLQTEAVTYVVQRVESLMGLFYLLTIYCFIRSVESPRPWGWRAGAVAACLCGMATKEVMVTAPALVLLYDRTFVAGSFREAWRLRRRLYLAMAATWLLLVGLVASAGWDRNGTSGFDVGVTPGAYWLTQLEAVPRYLWLSVWPHPLVFEYGTFWVRHPDEVVPYALLVVLLAAATLVALWRRPVLGFLGAWFFAILAPTSVIPGRIQMIVEHRMYLPLAAVIALAVGGSVTRLGRRSLAAFLALVVAAGWLTERRNEAYRSGVSLWLDTVAKRPNNARAHNCLGVVLFDAGRIPEAIQRYQTALRLKPDYPEAHNNLGYALTKAGRIPEAIAELGIALRMEPDYAKAHTNLGNALLAAGRIAEAIQHYEAALRSAPDDPKPHYNLGNALLASGWIPAAIEEYGISLRINPDDAEAHFNLGNALFQAGRVAAAIEHYEAAERIRPDYAEAHSNHGNALLQLKRIPEALAEFTAALRINPDYAEGHNNLGAALYQAGRIEEAIQQFEAALRLKPDYSDARHNLEWLRAPAAAAGDKH